MKAVKSFGARDLRIVEVEEPSIQDPEDVKIKVCYSGICPDEIPFFRKDMDMLAWGSVILPLNGHEVSGIIVDAGIEAKKMGFVPGVHVGGYAWKHCGHCYYCRSGYENLCSHLEPSQSTLAEYVVWNMDQLIKLQNDLPLEVGCFADPIGFSLHGIERVNLKLGESVLIVGATGHGLILTQLAVRNGASSVTLVDPFPENRELAKKLGAKYVIDPQEENMAKLCLRITENRGFNVIFETTGVTEMMGLTSKFLSKQGRFAFGSTYGFNKTPPITLSELFVKEASLIPFHMAPYKLPLTEYFIHNLELMPLVSKIFPMEEATEAYKCSEEGRYPHILIKVT